MAKVLIFAYFVKNLIEMRSAEGIVAISIPFTAGAAMSAAMQQGGGETCIWMAAASCVILAVLLPLSCLKGNGSAFILSSYFFLGVLCHASSACGISTGSDAAWAEDWMAKFCGLIDSLDFKHDSTGPLIRSLLTGRRYGLDRHVMDGFRKSGASHILALSGLHLGILYGILKRALSVLGNTRPVCVIRSLILIAASAFYMSVTGASPSMVRAFLFITVGELSRMFPGRRRSNMSTYCTALTVQLCISPQVISSTGFQLSYLAMLGIFTLFPTLNSWYPSSTGFDPLKKIWTSAALSISCQFFTAPLVWFRFHSFPTYFLLTNIVALPLAEALMLSAAGTLSLAAAGRCPEIAKGLTDFLGQTLISCLEIIGSL